MRKFGDSGDAVSPVVGVILMVGMIVIMVSIIAVSVYGFSIPESAPHAKIVVREARGNISYLTGNEIVLVHKGGDTLYPDKVKILISGEGRAALKGDSIGGSITTIKVSYENLLDYNYVNSSGNRKDRYFLGYDDIEFAKIIQGDAWSTGRKVVLYGADGRVEDNENSVNKKWELNPGSTVTITLIDIPSSQVIAVTSAKVKESGQVVGT